MRLRLAAVGLLVLVLGACSSDEAASGPPPTLAPVSTTDPQFAGIPAGGDVIGGPTVDVVLVDQGTEPRRELRLAPSVGTVQAQTTVVDQGITVEVNGVAQAVPSAGLEMDVTYTVDAVDDESISYRVRYDDLRAAEDVDPSLASAFDEMRSQLVGTEGVVVVDRRGGIISSSVGAAALGESASDMVDEASSLSTPLPAEPVGVGARFEVRTSTSASGMLFNVSSLFQVVELTDEHVVMDVEVRMNMPSGIQTILGRSVQVGGGDIVGDGRTTWRFDQPVPEAQQSASGSISMSMSSGGESANMTLTMRQRFEQRTR